MTIETDNIELRSEKVRNIIGQIPPILIRFGITLIFIIIIGILTGTYFFKYNYTIKTTAIVEQKNSSINIKVKVAANEINKVKKGQKVILNFNNIPNLYNQQIAVKVQTIPNVIEISKNGGYFIINIILLNDFTTESNKIINITKPTEVNALLITDKISFFDRIIEPFKNLINARK